MYANNELFEKLKNRTALPYSTVDYILAGKYWIVKQACKVLGLWPACALVYDAEKFNMCIYLRIGNNSK